MTLPTPSGRWTTTARPAFAVAAALSLGGNLLSLWIGSWKSSDLPADAGYAGVLEGGWEHICLLYTSPSPRDQRGSRMPSSA